MLFSIVTSIMVEGRVCVEVWVTHTHTHTRHQDDPLLCFYFIFFSPSCSAYVVFLFTHADALYQRRHCDGPVITWRECEREDALSISVAVSVCVCVCVSFGGDWCQAVLLRVSHKGITRAFLFDFFFFFLLFFPSCLISTLNLLMSVRGVCSCT